MRDVALLGAACHLATPSDEVPAADEGWPAQPQARAALRKALRSHELSDDPAKRRLTGELGLPMNAYWLVMLCAAVELHPEAGAAVSLLTEDARQLLPTPTVVARLLRGILEVPYEEALAGALGGGPAARLGLVEVQEAAPPVPHSQQPLRLAFAELAIASASQSAVQGGLSTDAGGPTGPAVDLPMVSVPASSQTAFGAERVGEAVRLLERRHLLVLRGRSRRGCRQLACDVAAVHGKPASIIAAQERLPSPAELARVRDGLAVLDLHPMASFQPGALAQLATALPDLLVLVDEAADTGTLAVVDADAIDFPAAQRIWQELLPAGQAQAMAVRFRVSIEDARAALAEVADLTGAAAADPDAVAGRLRAQGARRMGRYITLVETSSRLSDLVVPETLAVQMDEIVSWQRSSHRVRWDMALGAGDPIGTGLTCLFAGKSGTGKTLAARCLANELGLNLYRIDLSQVVSKYIGETEKALAQIFDEVEAGHGVLLFDEADALFGRRSEVKDAHDRYANIEVGYLLQRLETYEGVAILTTNLQGNMDAAFVRRLRFILHFPAPDRDLRRRLWEQSLPGEQWREDDLELDALADRFPLSGGSIHNIGLAAAHLAAATDAGKISLAHVVRATQRELQKAGRPADAAAFGSLAGQLAMNGAAR